MSGFVGIVNLDHAPIDEPRLRQMTACMAFRGPDAQYVWHDGHVGFGHALLRSTCESAHERQLCSLDGKVWITADVRLDARPDLLHGLRGTGREVPEQTPDVEVILHAYHAWGGNPVWNTCRVISPSPSGIPADSGCSAPVTGSAWRSSITRSRWRSSSLATR
jgi:asparagine synthetase B (glutamine-hydrolysing)